MAKGGSRKPNLSRIRTSRSYEVKVIAKTLDRSVYTVRAWIKQGLPVLPDTSPRLIDGQELKEWLAAKWQSRKKPCGIGELFCCRCCQPRAPKPTTVKTETAAATTTFVMGNCEACGTHMQQVRKTEKLPEILAAMMAKPKRDASLIGYRDSIASPMSLEGQGAFNFDRYEGDPKSVH